METYLSAGQRLARYPFYWAALADLQRPGESHVEARASYERAIELSRSPAERHSYQRRIELLKNRRTHRTRST
jgi:predicted RNA polymerase sigma factor